MRKPTTKRPGSVASYVVTVERMLCPSRRLK